MPKGSMYLDSRSLGLKGVPIPVLYRPKYLLYGALVVGLSVTVRPRTDFRCLGLEVLRLMI